MNDRIDPLAVLRKAEAYVRDAGDSVHANKVKEARADIAALVEAAELACSTWPETAKVCGLRAAIAPFNREGN